MRLVGVLRGGAPVDHMANLNGCINGPYRQQWGRPERPQSIWLLGKADLAPGTSAKSPFRGESAIVRKEQPLARATAQAMLSGADLRVL